MPDVYHEFGSDLALSASGDILTTDGTQLGQQRVLRRLLTNPGDYIWQLPYGAGIAGFVGSPTNIPRIAAVIKTQMYREAIVSRNPAPSVAVSGSLDGSVTASIRYADAIAKLPVSIAVSLANQQPSASTSDSGFVIGVSVIGDTV